MISVPSEIAVSFNSALARNRIPGENQNHYRKWLRYYLDFCHKYHIKESQPDSLRSFIKKLSEKRQSQEHQKQATHAISLFYEIIPSPDVSGHKIIPDKDSGVQVASERVISSDENREWKSAFSTLSSEIKLRHYSLKTLKTYTLWLKKFQVFTRNKDPQMLSSNDVKEF